MGFNKKKIFLIVSCLLNIFCIWVALTLQIRHDYLQTKEAAETNVFNLAIAFEEHVVKKTTDIDRVLLDLRSRFSEDPANFNLMPIKISDLGHDIQQIQLSVINQDGTIIYADQSSPLVTSLDKNERKQLVHNVSISNYDPLFINRPLIDPDSGEWRLQLTRKLFKKDGSVVGIIAVSIPPSFFGNFFNSINIGKNGSITLFATDKFILASASGIKNIVDATGQQIAADHPFVTKKIQNGIYGSTSEIDGTTRLSAYRKIKAYPLVVQVSLSEEDIFLHSSKRKRNILLIGAIISIALTGALAVLLQFEREQQKLLDKVSKRDEQLQETLKELEHLVTTDTLTGLPNRRSFFARAQTEFTRSNRYDRPLSLVMIDVDHFKDVNDKYGHLAGDEALRHISEIMKSCIREADMVARYGGEEFVLILPETDPEGAHFIAERVRSEIEASGLQIDSTTELKLTVSLGIACMSRENRLQDIDRLLQEADDAMYRAKAGGRNCVYVTQY